jgi:protein phosphatase-4 regulatory subunit 3
MNSLQVQGRDSSSFLSNAATAASESNGSSAYESDDEGAGESNENYLSPTINLPPVDLTHLRDICDLFSPEKVRDATRRDLLARAIESNNYIRKLIDLFHICEDLENTDSLRQLYDIIRSIFYLNKSSLFEVLFSDEFILDVIGCLEYDSQLNYAEKRNHREFLDTKATFKEVIPIGSQELISKIHQTYRVQYIQDAILPAPSLFEENLLSTMNSFLFFNKVDIVTLLYVRARERPAGQVRRSLLQFLV